MALTDHNFGVVILCPDLNTGGLRYTTNSIKSDFPGVKHVAVIGNNSKDIDVDALSKCCSVKVGGKTITSLIDVGMKSLSTEWCLIVMSGSMVRYPVYKKYRYFADDNAILYPVIDRKHLFHEASINGIFLRKKAYEEIGEFGDDLDDIKEAKLLWAGRAMERGYKFKALVGARFI